MKKVINIIVDASGSMIEDEKNAIVKYLLNGIASAKRNNHIGKEVTLRLFQWGKETKQIEDIENAKINFGGKTNLKGVEKLAEMVERKDTILLISDGNFEVAEKRKFKELSNHILTIFVGVDANRVVLQELSTNETVYSVVDFMQALLDA